MNGRRALAALTTIGTLGAAVGAIASGPAVAAGEGGNGSANCPTSNPPNAMTLVAGTPQTATLGSAFGTGMQVALTNTDGCAVTSAAAGVPVTFTAPTSGASGVFSDSATNTATVGADSGGSVMAPTFTANAIAGSYTVTATSQYGSVSFSLTNTAAGVPARIVTVSPAKQTATVVDGYRDALAVRVLDANGNPVAGVSVTFTFAAGSGSSACGTSASSGSEGASADASFSGGAAQASATSNAAGIATSPGFTANGDAGTFGATATTGSAGGEKAAAASSGATPAVFTLTNLAGTPAKLAPGIGATQSTHVGARFAVRLAVTVTDAEGNRVPRALVSFTAPARGASGSFATAAARPHGRSKRAVRTRVAHVRANACGVAVAPAFTADRVTGGYIVKASSAFARAAFALVNEAP
jgi:hypothetical protein